MLQERPCRNKIGVLVAKPHPVEVITSEHIGLTTRLPWQADCNTEFCENHVVEQQVQNLR